MDKKYPISIQFQVSLKDFEQCSRLFAARIRERNFYRTIVTGIFLVIFAMAFIAYAFFGLHRVEWYFYLLALVLLVLGVYNILYYPLLFDRFTARNNRRHYKSDAYFREPVRLELFEDYLIEHSANGANRVMWQSVHSILETQELYFLRIYKHSGIIIPKAQLDSMTMEKLDDYLKEILRRFEKESILLQE